MGRRFAHDTGEALATAVLAVAVVVGSAFLWIGIPVLGLLLAGAVTTTAQGFLLAALGGIPTAMVAFGWMLYRLNGMYEGVHGGDRPVRAPRSAWLVASSDERRKFRRARAPRTLIDLAMTASAVTALILLLTWFFFAAGSPLVPMA